MGPTSPDTLEAKTVLSPTEQIMTTIENNTTKTWEGIKGTAYYEKVKKEGVEAVLRDYIKSGVISNAVPMATLTELVGRGGGIDHNDRTTMYELRLSGGVPLNTYEELVGIQFQHEAAKAESAFRTPALSDMSKIYRAPTIEWFLPNGFRAEVEVRKGSDGRYSASDRRVGINLNNKKVEGEKYPTPTGIGFLQNTFDKSQVPVKQAA